MVKHRTRTLDERYSVHLNPAAKCATAEEYTHLPEGYSHPGGREGGRAGGRDVERARGEDGKGKW